MSAGNVARVVAVLAACVAAAGSATSNSNRDQALASSASQSGPPPPQQMDAARALGLWRSTFGAVKIEPDASHGGLDSGNVQGIWVYQRQGQEVVGYFAGNLRGNVLQFRWQEPNDPPLTGEGFLVFDQQGRQYSGRWWSEKRDRVGDWSGWRQATPPHGACACRARRRPTRPTGPATLTTRSRSNRNAPPRNRNPYRPQQRQPQQQPQVQPQPAYVLVGLPCGQIGVGSPSGRVALPSADRESARASDEPRQIELAVEHVERRAASSRRPTGRAAR